MSLDARIIGVIGASMQGKGLLIKQALLGIDFKGHEPILVWSPYEHRDEYAKVINGTVVRSFEAFKAALLAGHKRIVFVPNLDEKIIAQQFALFCAIAWHIKDAVLLVEELSLVTKPGYAPPPWKMMSTGGRGEMHAIIATSQRPQGMDKDFLGNCTEIFCFRVNTKGAVMMMADTFFVHKTEISRLLQFHYLHRSSNTGKIRTGMVKLPPGVAKPADPAKKSASPRKPRARKSPDKPAIP